MASSTKKAGRTYCCVVGCHRNEGVDRPHTKFFTFPTKNQEQRELWIKAISRKNPDNSPWEPTKYSKICSDHFPGKQWSRTRGHPDYVPSVFPTKHVREQSAADSQRFGRAMKRRQRSLEQKEEERATTSAQAQEEEDEEEEEEIDVQVPEVEEAISKTAAIQTCKVATKNKGNQTRPKVKSRKQQTDKKLSRMQGLRLESATERQIISFTGVSSKFLQLLNLRLEGKVKDSYKLTKMEKIQLVFVKLKLNISFTVLGGMFNISTSHSIGIFSHTLTLIYENLKVLLCWFNKDRIQSRMPACFKGLFPDARVILDATEVPCEKPASKKMDIQLYSHYKGRHTVKFLVGIAPSGEITFLSKASGGRTTDTELTVRSGLLKLIEPGDIILADKGFPRIETDLNVRGGILVMPPIASGERQFTSAENKQGFQCATVRIHVERAIQRMKHFQILHFMPLHMFKYVDKILVIIAVVCNCFNDLIKQ